MRTARSSALDPAGPRPWTPPGHRPWTPPGLGPGLRRVVGSGLRWVGRIGPWQPLDWPGTEVGWALHRDAWGKGYAVEAAVAAVDYAFDALGWTEVVHCINPENAASQKVAKRLGATIRSQATLPAPLDYERVDVWGQTCEEWRDRAQPR